MAAKPPHQLPGSERLVILISDGSESKARVNLLSLGVLTRACCTCMTLSDVSQVSYPHRPSYNQYSVVKPFHGYMGQ